MYLRMAEWHSMRESENKGERGGGANRTFKLHFLCSTHTQTFILCLRL